MPETPAAIAPAPEAPPSTPPTTPAPQTPSSEPSSQPPGTATPPPDSRPRWEQDLDDIEAGNKPGEKVPAAREPQPKEEPAPKQDAKAATTAPKQDPDGEGMPSFSTNRDLRKWAKDRHTAAIRAEKELTAAKQALEKAATGVPKEFQDTQLMVQQMAEMKKTIDSYEKLLEVHVRDQSPTFVKEYKQPYFNAVRKAVGIITQLNVSVPTGQQDDEGNPIMQERRATEQDWRLIYSLPFADARKMARRMFGEDYDVVMNHYNQVAELAEKHNNALKEWETGYQKQRQEEYGKQRTQRLAMENLWRTANERISSDPKRKEDWGTPEDDADGAQALTDGFQLADLFFGDEHDAMKPDEKVAFDANIRHRIAGFSYQRYLVRKLRQELQAKDSEIAQLRGSAPGKPTPTGETPPSGPKSVMAALDGLPD
jgi:hypothetical protein